MFARSEPGGSYHISHFCGILRRSALMAETGVLCAVLPEGTNPERLARLVAAGAPADPLLRLAALLTGCIPARRRTLPTKSLSQRGGNLGSEGGGSSMCRAISAIAFCGRASNDSIDTHKARFSANQLST